jgi:hypothetical protein
LVCCNKKNLATLICILCKFFYLRCFQVFKGLSSLGGGLLGAAKSAVAAGEKVAESAVAASEKALDKAESLVEAAEAAAAEKAAELSAASRLPEAAGEKAAAKSASTTASKEAAPAKKEPKKPADYDDYWYKGGQCYDF